jgi:ElaA protein
VFIILKKIRVMNEINLIMTWVEKTFEELTTTELYALLHLRAEVFVVEQQCPYQDVDYNDMYAVHVMGYDDQQQLGAYARVFAPGVRSRGMTYDMASIGRVITSKAQRRKGVGKELMERAIATLENRFGKQPIKISAQQYLTKFYESLGFRQTSDMYLEDNIPHIEMIRE